MSLREDIQDFLEQKRVALVGVSRNERHFTRRLFREFVKRGYDAVAVNPHADSLDGRACFRRVQDIQPAVEGVLVLTPPKITEKVVLDCAAAGIRRVWMYRAVGQGAVSRQAVGFCRSRGMRVIPGYCPFMFWKEVSFIHRLHRLLSRPW